jgi:hypothetical protein
VIALVIYCILSYLLGLFTVAVEWGGIAWIFSPILVLVFAPDLLVILEGIADA